MNKLFIIIVFIFFCKFSFGQTAQKIGGPQGYEIQTVKAPFWLIAPSYSDTPTVPAPLRTYYIGAIVQRRAVGDTSYYGWIGYRWIKIGGGISGNGNNFANTDLFFTGPRYHSGSGFPLKIDSLLSGEFRSHEGGSVMIKSVDAIDAEDSAYVSVGKDFQYMDTLVEYGLTRPIIPNVFIDSIYDSDDGIDTTWAFLFEEPVSVLKAVVKAPWFQLKGGYDWQPFIPADEGNEKMMMMDDSGYVYGIYVPFTLNKGENGLHQYGQTVRLGGKLILDTTNIELVDSTKLIIRGSQIDFDAGQAVFEHDGGLQFKINSYGAYGNGNNFIHNPFRTLIQTEFRDTLGVLLSQVKFYTEADSLRNTVILEQSVNFGSSLSRIKLTPDSIIIAQTEGAILIDSLNETSDLTTYQPIGWDKVTKQTKAISYWPSTVKTKGVFYVAENYTGPGAAIIGNLSNSSVSSSNTSYTAQLSFAKMGSETTPFPDPWTARNAALDSIANGSISDATIIVIKGVYTVGSDVAANNGDSTGVASTATIADIGFTSIDGLDTSSLMKHKVNYIFNPGTGLILINKTYFIHAGCYTFTNTDFVSGIYGRGDFTIIYGSLEGLSQRFIQVKNSRAEITLEARNIIVQGPWNYTWIFKKETIKADKFVGDKLTMIVHMQNATGEDNGDGLPSTMNIEVTDVYKGHTYFPYPNGDITSGYRPLIALDYSSAVRFKSYNFKFKNVYLYDNALHTMLNAWATGGGRDVYNHNLTVTIDYFQHDMNIADQAAQTNAGSIFQPISHGNINSYIRENVHSTINIKTAIVDHSLVSVRLIAPTHASSKNNSVTINVDYVLRRYKTGAIANAVGIENLFTIPYLQQGSSNTVVGEKVNVVFNVKTAIAKFGNCFGTSGVSPTYQMYTGANTTILGTYITEDGSPVMEINTRGSACFLKDAVFIAKGAATNIITVNNGGNATDIYTKDFLTNLALGAGLTQYGSYTTDANIINYH